MSLTALAMVHGISGEDLKRLLGMWTYTCSFRRETLAILETAYQRADAMPPRRATIPSGKLANELIALIFSAPALQACLRDPPATSSKGCGIFATDAAGHGGLGGCAAWVPYPVWRQAYDLSEPCGDYVRLDSDAPAHLRDHRSAAGVQGGPAREAAAAQRRVEEPGAR